MEILIELLIQLIFEVLWNLFFEGLFEVLGIRISPEKRTSLWDDPGRLAVFLLFMGCFTGVAYTLTFPEPLLPRMPFRGASLILSPLATGAVMEYYGRWRDGKGMKRTFASTFGGGAVFAFGASSTRLLALLLIEK